MALACAMAVLVLISSSLAAQEETIILTLGPAYVHVAASAQPGYRPPQRPPPPYAPQGPGYSRKCPDCNSGATRRAPSALAPHRKAMQAAPDVDSKTLARHATPTYI
ncbi:hypothetical protein TRIUR3_27619 [Triticum urartu]|uniref:Uncharacterized protein n=1 Tax=Triticum urartu TaxID=4572 RepID=M7XDI9_TRIUA|nr:hypothetical protein TRIUR3_27619 [Triticum urartu]